MQLEQLLEQLDSKPENTEFQDVIDVIDHNYHYTPTRFTNGQGESAIINEAGENEGSCKIFSFAELNGLTEEQTLNCFGRYYRDDVLKNPDGTDHQNIRTFIKHGWKYVDFEKPALKKR
jgi:hypothetical protein